MAAEHGTPHDGNVDPARPNFGGVPGYKPIVGGVRHLTRLGRRPPAGTLVTMLCGDDYQLPRRSWTRQVVHVYDCSACALVYVEGEDEW